MISDQTKSRYGNPPGANTQSNKHPIGRLSFDQGSAMSDPAQMHMIPPPADSAVGGVSSQESFAGAQMNPAQLGGEGTISDGADRIPVEIYGY